MDALKDLSVSVIYDTNQRAEEDISLRNSLHHASEGDTVTDPKYIVIGCISFVLLLVVLAVVASFILWRKTVINYVKSWFTQPSAPAHISFEPAWNTDDSYDKEAHEKIIDIPEDIPERAPGHCSFEPACNDKEAYIEECKIDIHPEDFLQTD